MSLRLCRIDDRLIHGQVVVGWGAELHPQEIIVVDDDLAGSAWEQELYRLGIAEGMRARFVTVEQAIPGLEQWTDDETRRMLLTRDIPTMLRLAGDGRLGGREVNVGGLHYAPGREAVLPYVYLDDSQREALAALVDEGVTVIARDLPGGKRVPAERLLREPGS